MHIEGNSVSVYQINKDKRQMLTWNLTMEKKQYLNQMIGSNFTAKKSQVFT